MLLMSSERTYSRGYLTPDGYYRQNIEHLRTKEGYAKEDKGLSLGKTIGIGAGLALAGGSAKYLFESGALRPYIQRFVKDFANSEGMLTYKNMVEAVKEITDNPKGNLITDMIDIVGGNVIKNANEKAKLQTAMKQQAVLENLETIRFMKEKHKVLAQLRTQSIDLQVEQTLDTVMTKKLAEATTLDAVKELEYMQRGGIRHATLSDVMRLDRLSGNEKVMVQSLLRDRPTMGNHLADKLLFITDTDELIDIRDTIKAGKAMGSSFINDFAIPGIGINPAKMFEMDELLNLTDFEAPMFHLIKPTDKQPNITYRIDEVGDNMIYAGGDVYDTVYANRIQTGMIAKDSTRGKAPRETRVMWGMSNAEYKAKWDTPLGRLAYKGASLMDIGFQDEVYRQGFDIMHPGTALNVVSQKLHDILSPVQMEKRHVMKDTFGPNNPYLFQKKAAKFGQEGFGSQLVAGRNTAKNITTATHGPYMLMERMSRSLQPYNMALSNKSLGSAQDAFVGLFGKRILPIVLGLGALKYADYLLENKEGRSPKDAITDGIANADTNLAALRDKAKINDRMKTFKEISPGIEFLAEIPFVGKLFDSKTEEEAKEYWEDGYDPVRKGRFWTLGNTPYGGGRIEYFRPNLKNRVQSDYQYTDVKWGSKKEFWENNWLPTPTNPFSPIKHFITDPYHWEKKHYKDRPYPITGGIAEFKEIPIIGGFLDSTVGRILKPQKRMHTEYWNGDQLDTTLNVEQVPFEQVTRPTPGMTGAPGRNNIPTSRQDTHDDTVYSTSSGLTSVYATRKDINPYEINKSLQTMSIKRIPGTTQVSKGSVEYGPLESKMLKPFNPNSLAGAVENAYTDITDLAGFYGFAGSTVMGDGEVLKPRLATSSDLYSYSDAFWDKSLGGFGGEISEIFRRFAPNKSFAIKKAELNPIRNTMPTWLPGPEYYINFLHGDPYEKVKEGEYRLPGAGYEAMYGLENPMEFKIGSSSIGNTLPDLIKHWLQVDDIEISENESLKSILDSGTRTHEKIENEWMKIGYAVAHEYYVKDEANNIEGWVDAIVRDNTSKTGYAVSDVKTINDRGYQEVLATGKVKENYKAQINFYMHQMGYDKGYLHFVNRDNPDADPITVSLDYDKDYLQSVYDKLELSRNIMREAIDKGVVQRGDLYKPIDRFKILADVAPYSENFRFYNSLMSKLPLKEDDKAEVAKIRERVTKVKEKMRVTPYKFMTANLREETVTINKVLDDGTILTNEYQNNPLKLAGIDFSTNEDTETGAEAMAMLKGRLRKGSKVRIGLNADDLKRVNDDTYSTMDAVFDVDSKVNLNKQMLNRGIATEKENDDSATSVHARFTKGQIRYGSIFESLSHRDTLFNTKFLQARSALEQYERRDVYGKDWQDWTSPVEDFLVPTIQNTIRKNPLVSTSIGMFVGAMFGAPNNRYGKLVGGAIGGTIGLIGGLSVMAKEKVTGEAYIPERRVKERELNEYFDMLKYVKSMKLFDRYSDAAVKQEGVDPREIIAKNKRDGDYRKYEINKLEDVKRNLHNETISFKNAKKIARYDGNDIGELESHINKRLNNLKNHRDADPITPLAAQAIMYYNESEKTAYGYDPGDPVQNVLAALNRKERKYFMPFLEAPEEERDQILRIAPSYMKRALQSAYGRRVDEKVDIQQYFSEHFLPGDDWGGWNPNVNLDDVKVKMVRHEGMDASEFDIWDDDQARADHLDIPLPKINFSEKTGIVKDKLRSVLSNAGLEDLEVEVSLSDTPGINVQMDIEKDRRKDIENYVNSYGIF